MSTVKSRNDRYFECTSADVALVPLRDDSHMQFRVCPFARSRFHDGPVTELDARLHQRTNPSQTLVISFVLLLGLLFPVYATSPSIALADDEFPPELTQFVPFDRNPVFQAA